MRSIDWNMDAIAGAQAERVRAMLQRGPVTGGIVINGPEEFDLFFGQNFAIIRVENVDGFLPLDLQDEVALAVNMIGAEPVRGSDKNDGILATGPPPPSSAH